MTRVNNSLEQAAQGASAEAVTADYAYDQCLAQRAQAFVERPSSLLGYGAKQDPAGFRD